MKRFFPVVNGMPVEPVGFACDGARRIDISFNIRPSAGSSRTHLVWGLLILDQLARSSTFLAVTVVVVVAAAIDHVEMIRTRASLFLHNIIRSLLLLLRLPRSCGRTGTT